MTKMTAKFANADASKLTIYARPGKKAIHIGATLKPKGQPAQSGCRQKVVAEADAVKAFNALKADAVKNGWVEAPPKKERISFTVIPPAKSAKKTAA